MKGSSDSNDVVPKATLYFYPPDEQMKKQKQLDCGELVGIVQYFQHDLFRSIARTLYFQKAFIAHEHHGRHSAFLCVPDDRYTAEETHTSLKHILNLFNMLHGTWNHIQSIHEKEDQISLFLNQALTPIVSYVLNQHRSISNLFSTIEYIPLKSDNQRILLESKHYLGYLKSKYGLHDGFLGYDDRILYSTCDLDTTFYLQLLYQLKNELSESLIALPRESDFQLKNGVSLFRIYIRQPLISKPTKKKPPTNPIRASLPIFKITSEPIDIDDEFRSVSDDSPTSSSQNPLHRLSVPSFTSNSHRSGMIFFTDPSGSSEETGFDTDTTDDLSPSTNTDVMSSSSISLGENPSDLNTEDSVSSSPSSEDEPLTDEQKLKIKSRSSTISGELEIEKTLETERKNSADGPVQRIHLTQVDSIDTSDDEESFRIHQPTLAESTRDRTRTITSDSDSNTPEFLRNDLPEVQMTWTNIPDQNTEYERDELVLYVQRNSRTIFAGIIEQSLLTDDYLNKLWNLMLSQMANIDAEIQVKSTINENIKFHTDTKFKFNEDTRLVEFERTYDGTRYSRRIPSEESTSMAFFARTELNRNPERKVIGFSRGSHYVSLDRRIPHRINYFCQRYNEPL